jgi:hypothetical protein
MLLFRLLLPMSLMPLAFVESQLVEISDVAGVPTVNIASAADVPQVLASMLLLSLPYISVVSCG